jgi:hypothetical protein
MGYLRRDDILHNEGSNLLIAVTLSLAVSTGSADCFTSSVNYFPDCDCYACRYSASGCVLLRWFEHVLHQWPSPRSKILHAVL